MYSKKKTLLTPPPLHPNLKRHTPINPKNPPLHPEFELFEQNKKSSFIYLVFVVYRVHEMPEELLRDIIAELPSL